MLSRLSMRASIKTASASLRCSAVAPQQPAPLFGALQRRCLSSRAPGGRFGNKRRVEVLEKEAEPPSAQQGSASPFGFGQQQQGGQQQQFGAAPSSSFPMYTRDREKEKDQQGSQYEALGAGVVAHMRKVYGTLAIGIGIAAGASMFTMATPLIGIHPLIPGIGAMIPLMGIMYTDNHSTSPALRAAMFAAFTGLSGMSIGTCRAEAHRTDCKPTAKSEQTKRTGRTFGAQAVEHTSLPFSQSTRVCVSC